MSGSPATMNRTGNAAQTVLRALGLLEAVATGIHDLESLSQEAGLPESTAYRLFNTLVQASYLASGSVV